MDKIYYSDIKETLYHEKMKNGLEVFLMPKDNFNKTYGLFTTDFGSIDRSFIPLGKENMITVPDGVAHFLEHKMFDLKNGDASEEFAKLGASSNAYTSNVRTSYLFSTTQNENECTELLLDFVQELNVTEESVEKEKGIIIQEIGMYDDNPDWQSYFGAIKNLYHQHPVKIDIAGTADTVRKIDKTILYDCYRTFYQPSNMVLFIAGHIQPDKLMDIIRDNQDKKSFVSMSLVTRGDYHENKSVFCRREVKYMDVSASKVSIALKINDIPSNIQDRLNRELAFTILLDMLFSKSSDIREEWTLRELINDSFDVTFIQERDYSLFFMSSDTEKTNELEEVFHQFIKNMKDYSADPVIFERMKKKNIGMIIQAFNSPETIASLFSRYYFEGINAFDLISLINNLDIKEIRKISNLFDDDLTSTFLIIPEGKNID